VITFIVAYIRSKQSHIAVYSSLKLGYRHAEMYLIWIIFAASLFEIACPRFKISSCTSYTPRLCKDDYASFIVIYGKTFNIYGRAMSNRCSHSSILVEAKRIMHPLPCNSFYSLRIKFISSSNLYEFQWNVHRSWTIHAHDHCISARYSRDSFILSHEREITEIGKIV